MSSVVLSGDSSGQVTLTVPSTAGTNTATLPAATGTVMVSGNMPAFSAYANAGQSISTATYTKIQLNAEEFDTANCFDSTTNYRFTPTVAGYYLISACIYFNIAPTTLANGGVYIWKNGSSYKNVNIDSNSTNGHYGSTVTSVIYFNGTTDYVEMYVYQATGSSQSITGASNATYMSGVLVRAA